MQMAAAERQASLVSSALDAAQRELARLRALDLAATFSPEELLGPERPAATIVIASAAPVNNSSSDHVLPSSDSVRQSPPDHVDGDDDGELSESAQAEMRRLEATVAELSETNDRIMAQNIALLADLEVAQRAVRDLRADKDTLAVQLKRALTGGQ